MNTSPRRCGVVADDLQSVVVPGPDFVAKEAPEEMLVPFMGSWSRPEWIDGAHAQPDIVAVR